MTLKNKDFMLDSYDFPLTEENIAQEPADKRDCSKLMVLTRTTDAQAENTISTFSNLVDHLPPGALLVANNSRVLPARVHGKSPKGTDVEFLLLTPLPLIKDETPDAQWCTALAKGLIKGSKRRKIGEIITFSDDLNFEIVEKHDFGQAMVRLHWKGNLGALFNSLGEPPLPPYIKRATSDKDFKRYQTIYADDTRQGSVAAPTAGLHFTPELKAELEEKGFGWAEVTLYVGYGTFSPVRCDDVREHEMHAEYVELSDATAQAILKAKSEGRPVVAVGTTTVRTLEGVWQELEELKDYSGWINMYIMPGYTFNVVDKLLTNFHLPKSSLLIMVSALAGRENILRAYQEALDQDFRFFSYGDAMLIL